ncbi:DUF3822 family protein [Tamlana fucoidanivorans]|uniref:DUF3822 family protein n=2 Tax=Allotamlana fucoidanivorans TaxID=2583814 RepID=A0A5C4SDW4_9FLAO|nr:DUF3822 family protein [Tamlana fucoidanivorans]
MAQTSNITNNKLTKLSLSIQISLSGLSFCILDTQSNTILHLKEKHFGKKLNPLDILNELTDLFNTDTYLANNFYRVTVIHDSDLSVQVPKTLFNEANLADYLKFNSKILKTDFVTFDALNEQDIINVYVPYVNVNNFIYDQFGDFTFKHISTVLIEELLHFEKHATSLKFYVHVSKDNFQIIVIEKGKLKLYNSFNYQTDQDFIYYILFTAEQLGLNPETFELLFLGDVNKEDALYQIAYKYIRTIAFGNIMDNYKFENSHTASNYSNFVLIKSISCV